MKARFILPAFAAALCLLSCQMEEEFVQVGSSAPSHIEMTVEAAMPGKPNVVVMDTSFGMTLPAKAYRYAIPTEYYEKYHIRRYGFHGTSHSFVSKETIKYLNLDPLNERLSPSQDALSMCPFRNTRRGFEYLFPYRMAAVLY